MRNVRVKIIGQSDDFSLSVSSLDLVIKLFHNLVTLLDTLFAQLTERHLADVVPYLDHLLVHHIDVENQFDKTLD